MTFKEFKAWFDGFCENISEPTPNQWKKVREKLAEVIDVDQPHVCAPIVPVVLPMQQLSIPVNPSPTVLPQVWCSSGAFSLPGRAKGIINGEMNGAISNGIN